MTPSGSTTQIGWTAVSSTAARNSSALTFRPARSVRKCDTGSLRRLPSLRPARPAAQGARPPRPALLHAGEPDAEALAELRHALGLDVARVARAELAHRLGVGCGAGGERRELGEEVLEARGGDDLEDPRGRVTGVP